MDEGRRVRKYRGVKRNNDTKPKKPEKKVDNELRSDGAERKCKISTKSQGGQKAAKA